MPLPPMASEPNPPHLMTSAKRHVHLPRKIGERFRADGDDQVTFLVAEFEHLAQITGFQGGIWVMQKHVSELVIDNGGGKHAAQPVRG